jgi:hypothetical protein
MDNESKYLTQVQKSDPSMYTPPPSPVSFNKDEFYTRFAFLANTYLLNMYVIIITTLGLVRVRAIFISVQF